MYPATLHLVSLGGPVGQLSGVLLPDCVEDPVVVPRVAAARRLPVRLPDWTMEETDASEMRSWVSL